MRHYFSLSTTDPEEVWLTSTEAAAMLGVHPVTLKRAISIPYFKTPPNGWRKYRRSDVERYLEAHMLDVTVTP